ncbi:MAG: hypothetical protein KAY24_02325 [Candidatus Eisenbacteria sp.]|nr:hypothetical protein [Candidatus Eisenbacteria bacterium]
MALARRVFYIGSHMSAALVAVGYIVNLQIAVLITFGGVIGWVIRGGPRDCIGATGC